MNSFSRRGFLQLIGTASAAALGAGVIAAPARAQGAAQFKLKYANNLAIAHPLNVRAKEAAEAIRRETGGRVELQIFPNGQMGTDTDMLSQVRSGAIDFLTQGGTVLSTLVPVSSINGIGFAFKDYNEVWTAMDGALGAHIRAAISKVGLVAMDKVWDNGFRHVTSSIKPVQSPADLKGLKIRVPVSPLWTSMFKAFDASPTSINFSETYSALQTKVVDAQENPLALIDTGRFYEVQKYCSLTGHMWDGFWFLANARSWGKLPPQLQTVVAKHLNAAAVKQRADIASLNSTLATQLQTRGMVFNKPEIEPFRTTLQKAGFYDQWRKKYGDESWALLEKYTQKLA
ncbi:ABC transporter substrate-binding protein [Burkholderia sp. SRS-W-2-2016]|uniref:TRAP transporter substrate-binding protein n=1 Tax=Burkholderia sp. SRS-W-2-2016 TaxID=1926878 RepID=UPI00094ABDDB|nr:TRAP transporter substrate-binding protein [Burkholderia sp. SRS-W-2-2016]OLL29201.1 ABC transporter substrate-binding protein [Burkholderia sp. SRS-W-2-2016]